MRYSLLIIIATCLMSCNISKEPLKSSDVIGEWFVQNEALLHADLLKYIKEDSILHPNEQDWFVRHYELFDTTRPVGQFTKMIMQQADCMGIQYIYNKRETPKEKILITANYQKSCVNIVDSILENLETAELFAIQKYKQAADEMTLYQLEEGDISSNDIAAKIKNKSIPYDITFFLRGKRQKLTNQTEQELTKEILGEELYLKKAGSVSWQFTESFEPELLTIGELKKVLVEKNNVE